jgi:hypothetical protein
MNASIDMPKEEMTVKRSIDLDVFNFRVPRGVL